MINLHNFIESLSADKVWAPTFKKKIKADFPEQYSWVLGNSKNAVCFDIGNVEDVVSLSIVPELFRSPYPCIWLEGQNRDGIIGILCCEVGDQKWNVAVANKLRGAVWQLVCVLDVFVQGSQLRCRELAMFCGEESKNDLAYEYGAQSINLLGSFLMAINCVNTSLIENSAPIHLNKKRIAKGKQPLFSYWTLHLPSGSNSNSDAGGTHSSPRLHLRRGHIRQHRPGKYSWVSACIVGNKSSGMVVKDYEVSRMVAQ